MIVTRGWLDPQNRLSLETGTAGRRIGLVVVSTDHDYKIRPDPGTRLTLRPFVSAISLPVVGGQAALGL